MERRVIVIPLSARRYGLSQARLLAYNYNISALVRKRSINVLSELEYDRGDIRKIKPYLPPSLYFMKDDPVDTPFDGKILRLNW